MADRTPRKRTSDDLVPPPPPDRHRADHDHDGELMNLDDLRREREGVPHVDLAQDIHRPPSSPQELDALRESADGDAGGAERRGGSS